MVGGAAGRGSVDTVAGPRCPSGRSARRAWHGAPSPPPALGPCSPVSRHRGGAEGGDDSGGSRRFLAAHSAHALLTWQVPHGGGGAGDRERGRRGVSRWVCVLPQGPWPVTPAGSEGTCVVLARTGAGGQVCAHVLLSFCLLVPAGAWGGEAGGMGEADRWFQAGTHSREGLAAGKSQCCSSLPPGLGWAEGAMTISR